MEDTLTFRTLDSKLGNHAPFLVSLSDGLQEELHIIIAGAAVGNLGDNIPDFEGFDQSEKQTLREILGKSRPIEASEQCSYEICFHNYIIYQIRNESFCSYDPDEIRHGRYLILFEKSKLLSHMGAVTDAQRLDDGSFYPGEWKHYGIYTQNHIIDVIALDTPDILWIKKDFQSPLDKSPHRIYNSRVFQKGCDKQE